MIAPLVVLAGLAFGPAPAAAPVQVEPAQYYYQPDWREREEWRRRRREEEWRRERWRREREYHEGFAYGRPPPPPVPYYGYGPRPY